ncbi:GIY-YIG nuclease family protein [Halosimplex salinum]|uniref:GIY-YIG nuclease family protein n=1 Tax=Halosimplex salinum TaxID=1710538 RepID=UPI001F4396FE|nr:GIY-YIG nuclease family protein [Halosimplex salinum]
MLSEKVKQVPTNTPGVYCLFDLDGEPAYGGKSSDVRGRLRQHFIRQDSSVASYGRLDIWDISHLWWWETDQYALAEQHLLEQFSPYLNFDTEHEQPVDSTPIQLDEPTGKIQLIDEEERAFRSQPYNRTKQKLEHLSRMVDKIRLAGHSEKTKQTLYEHQRILQENMGDFLDLSPSEVQAELDDYFE